MSNFVIQDACRALLNHVLDSRSSPVRDSPSSPYRPFGTYMFFSSSGAACIENSSTILEMLHWTLQSQEASFDKIVQACLLEHIRYGFVLEGVIKNSIRGRRLANPSSESSYQMGISLELEAIGVGAEVILKSFFKIK